MDAVVRPKQGLDLHNFSRIAKCYFTIAILGEGTGVCTCVIFSEYLDLEIAIDNLRNVRLVQT